MPHLLDPISIRSLTIPNRIFVSPMCEYSSEDGFANDWHLVHLGSRAVGGAGLVFTEATAVTDVGRISPQDLGIWKDEHVDMLARIVRFVHAAGLRGWHAAGARRPEGEHVSPVERQRQDPRVGRRMAQRGRAVGGPVCRQLSTTDRDDAADDQHHRGGVRGCSPPRVECRLST